MIIFPMAGLSSRFAKAGYSKPKYMLHVGELTVFEFAIRGFRGLFNTEQFLFIYLEGQVDPDFIKKCCERQGLTSENVLLVGLPRPTDGQATTVVEGMLAAGVDVATSLTIFNIDTFYFDFQQPTFLKDLDVAGYLDVFVEEGLHWSFVKPADRTDPEGVALAVVEKQRISDLCSSGLYYFRSTAMFYRLFDAYKHVPITNLQGGERYIAPLYQQLIDEGAQVRYRIIPREQVAFCGTPTEYTAFLAKHNFERDANALSVFP